MRDPEEEQIGKADDKLSLGQGERKSLRQRPSGQQVGGWHSGWKAGWLLPVFPCIHVPFLPRSSVLGTVTWNLLVPAPVKVVLV